MDWGGTRDEEALAPADGRRAEAEAVGQEIVHEERQVGDMYPKDLGQVLSSLDTQPH